MTDPAGAKTVKFSGWNKQTIPPGTTLDNSASLKTQMKAIFNDADFNCDNTYDIAANTRGGSPIKCLRDLIETTMIEDNSTSLSDTTFTMTVKHDIYPMSEEVSKGYTDRMEKLTTKYFAATEFYDGTTRVVSFANDYSLTAGAPTDGASAGAPTDGASTLSAIVAVIALSAAF